MPSRWGTQAMKRGQVIALALAAASGLGAVVLANSFMRPPPPAPKVVEKAEGIQVLVARSDIGLGQIANEANFRWQDWPRDASVRNFITRQTRPQAIVDLTGTIARIPISAGEPINEQKLVRAGQGGVLAAILRPGFRAMSIKISEQTAAGRLILPNDHVDILIVRRNPTKRGQEEAVPETLLHNIRILAIGQAIETKESRRSLEGATATLELTPRDAETLAQATAGGDLTLTLRSIADIAPDASDQSDKDRKEVESVRIIRYGISSRSYSVN